jgi:ATP-binding cassette subfamily C protein
MIDTLRKAHALLGPGAGGRWALLVALALLAAFCEAAGALIVFGMLTRITSGEGTYDVPLLGDLRDTGLDETTILVVVGVVLGLFFVLRAAVLVTLSYAQNRIAENAGARLASRLLAGYLAMPYTFHLQRNSAELIRNTYDTVQQFVKDGLMPAVMLIGQTVIASGLLAVLLYASSIPTLVAVAVLAPFTWVLLRFIHPRVKRLGVRAQALSKRNLRLLEESLSGWRDIHILGRESAFAGDFARDRHELAQVRYLASTARTVPRVALETGLVLVILTFLGVSVLAGGGALEALPVLGVFGYAAVRLQPCLNDILVALNSLKFVAPGIDLLHRDLSLFPPRRSESAHLPAPLRLRRELRLNAVTVRYPLAARNALDGIDLVIGAGEFVGIVGSTGGGKSTLVDVILGILEPASGEVTVDGTPLLGNEDAWHASLGVVHQTLFFSDSTIRRNIALGVPDDEMDEESVLEAIHLAQLDDFVRSLPDGLDTPIGQRGIRVSGGQRQRLAIARALYRRPSLLVLDEGTSALDHGTESDLIDALVPLRGSRTIVAVAHRLTTVKTCDRVVLVEDGRIVDVAPFHELAGRHQQLIAAHP